MKTETLGTDLHDVSADERNEDHEGPARNDSKTPEKVSKGNCKTKFGKRSVEWLEVSGVYFLLSVLFVGVKLGEGLDGGGCLVQGKVADFDRSWWSSNVNNP